MCISIYIFRGNYQLRSRALGPLLVALNQYTWIEAIQCTASYSWGSGNHNYQIGYLYPHNDLFFQWYTNGHNGWSWSKRKIFIHRRQLLAR